jgi:hypothetical protein
MSSKPQFRLLAFQKLPLSAVSVIPLLALVACSGGVSTPGLVEPDLSASNSAAASVGGPAASTAAVSAVVSPEPSHAATTPSQAPAASTHTASSAAPSSTGAGAEEDSGVVVDADAGSTSGGCSASADGCPADGSTPLPSAQSSATTPAVSSSPVVTIPDPLGADPKCSSGKTYVGDEDPRMRPGEACVECHRSQGEGPLFAIAGTVFPSGHEPDDCVGSPQADIRVVVTDANGVEHQLSVNSSGNFMYQGALTPPYTAKVISADGERLMYGAQTIGDCNTCHTQAGLNGAPGRIVPAF